MDWETGIKRGPFSGTQIRQLVEVMPGLNIGQVQWLNGYLTGISPLLEEAVLEKRAHVISNGSPASEAEPVWILYGTHTGNSERLAKESAKKITGIGVEARVYDMGSFKTSNLKKATKLLIIVSTDGEGDPPVQAESLLEFLHSNKCPHLQHTSYSVLALGDSSYTHFCKTGQDFDEALQQAGAKRIHDRIDCDVDFEDDYARWIEEVIAGIGQLSVSNDGVLISLPVVQETPIPAEVIYNRKNPFLADVLEKINLNGRRSSKETIHLELDLKDSHIQYEPGDALGIYALNSDRIVEPVLELLKFSGEEIVNTYQGSKPLAEALTSDYELTPLTGVVFKRYAEMTGSSRLEQIASDNRLIAEYIYGRDMYDLLKEEQISLTPEVFISLLRKNSPRMYSIASSQHVVENEVHVVVSVIRYEAYGRHKEGQCSSFLSDRINKGDQVKVFVDHNTRFKLPAEADRPVIMVGAGTGVAPFRAFVQEREDYEDRGKSWLFFGERNFATDFLYQTEWLQYIKEGVLTQADVAFSRDQEKKIYVQDRMLEHGKELYGWLEEGACFYVCGNKDHMAKDVDAALRKIIQMHGGLTEDKVAEYIKSLQQSNRYQVDVY